MKILIYGAGVIGGSIAKALILQGFEVFCINRSPLSFDGIKFFQSVEELPNVHFDIICVAVPRGRNYEIYQETFGKIKDLSCDFIVDCSSVQGQNEYLRGYFRGKFIPCHPIAGSEKVGFDNSDAKFLEGKSCIVIGINPPQAVINFWHACKMKTRIIATYKEHDEIYAAVSHLPQLISFFLPEPRELCTEFYRLKSSSRGIWDEIFLHNMENIQPLLYILGANFIGINFISSDQNMPFEKIISKLLLNSTRSDYQSFAGTGFETVTSCENISNVNCDERGIVHEIINKAKIYLVELKKSHKPSSITL